MRTARMLFIILFVLATVVACTRAPATQVPVAPTDTTAPKPTATPEPTAVPEPVEITYLYHDTVANTPGCLAQIEAANKLLEQQGKNIRIVGMPATGNWPEYHQKFLAQLAAGQSPDILNIAESQMPSLIAKGHALDLTPFLDQIDRTRYFDATFNSAGFHDGKYYGLPSTLYYLVMYYNKNLFDEAGLAYPSADWDNPITFDKLRDVAKQLTEGEGANKTFGLYIMPYMGYAGMYSRANGGTGVSYEDKTCALTEPAALEVYNWFDAIYRSDKSAPTPQDQAVISGFELFKTGRIAMYIDGNWFQSQFNKIEDFDVGIASLPTGSSGTAYTRMFVDNWLISKGSKHQAEAWEALKALFSQDGWTALAELSLGGIPVHRDVYEAFQDQWLGPQFTEEDRRGFTNGIDHALSVPYDEHYAEIDNEVNQTLSEWLNGDITAEAYAQRVCETWNEAWGK